MEKMTQKRIKEIKNHFRLFAPKNIHKEISEIFAYISQLEKFLDFKTKEQQLDLLGSANDTKNNRN